MKKIAINGFGRIGWASLKVIMKTPGLEVVAINDVMNLESAAYLLTYDSIYEKYEGNVSVHDNHFCVNDKKYYSSPKRTCYTALERSGYRCSD